jgi:hypothetical protein
VSNVVLRYTVIYHGKTYSLYPATQRRFEVDTPYTNHLHKNMLDFIEEKLSNKINQLIVKIDIAQSKIPSK